MKVRFDNPTLIVYKFISFKAFCLSSLAGRTKCFTAWQHKTSCRNAGQTTGAIINTVSLFGRDSLYSYQRTKIFLLKYAVLTKSLLFESRK